MTNTVGGGGGGSVLLAYIIQSFQKFFVLLSVRFPPSLKRKAFANIFWEHCLLPLLKIAPQTISFLQT